MTWWRPGWSVVAAPVVLVALVAVVRTAHARDARDALMRADPETILATPALARTALALGHQGFVQHCASCHGTGGPDQARGMPDLTDGDYLYGTGKVAEIEQIVLHGIRSGDPRGWQLAAMPAYSHAKPYAAEPIPPMTPAQIGDMIQFLQFRHGTATDAAAAARGAKVYAGSGGCYDCHGNDAAGDEAIGAPNLLDDVWLYGGSPATLARTFREGRAGVSPAYAHALSPAEARAIAVYVADLARHGRHDG
ncbi:c-type cytochrome [Sphingomonas bacterium]|uniref:c-type cytochrome n=1 Tax=Sphingomonas bacterium TaxID=1895847 RepID=UPI0015765C0B|nr:c-type cytochrome [Sphingomonas bacterium]